MDIISLRIEILTCLLMAREHADDDIADYYRARASRLSALAQLSSAAAGGVMGMHGDPGRDASRTASLG